MKATDLTSQFVMVIGGAGSGKNYYISHDPVLSSYHLVDIDEFKDKVGLDTAIKSIKPMLEDAFKHKLNVVHTGMATNIKGATNKIDLARKYGYSVTLILVDTNPQQAIANVAKRVAGGGHHVDDSVVIAANEKARQNYEILKQYVDSAKVVSN